MDYTLRPLDRSFAPQILAILNDAILHSTALYDYHPRTLDTMTPWFDAKDRGRYPVVGLVDAQERLLGFGSYGTFRAWPAYKYTIEHSLYVEQGCRGKGLGGVLLQALVDAAQQQGYHCMIGGIDSGNEASIRLHRKLGFTCCGRIDHAGYKFGRWLDLAFYQRLLPTPSEPVDG